MEAFDATFNRLISEQNKLQKKIDDLEKAMDAEKESLTALRGASEKAIKKRAYFEAEELKAIQKHKEMMDAIYEAYDSIEGVMDTKEENESSKKSIVTDKIDQQIDAIETKYQAMIETLDKELLEAIESLKSKYAIRKETLETKCKSEVEALQSKKEYKGMKLSMKSRELETARKVKEAKREAAIRKEKSRFENYLSYLKGQLEEPDIPPMSKRLATLKEQHRIALNDMEDLKAKYAIALSDMNRYLERQRQAAEEREKAEKHQAEVLALQKRVQEQQERQESHKRWLEQKAEEKRMNEERDKVLASMTPEEKADLAKRADEAARHDREQALKRSRERSILHDKKLEEEYKKMEEVEEERNEIVAVGAV